MTCDFSLRHYRELLEAGLAAGYRFIGFDDLERAGPGGPACILRHDVDYMPEWTVRLGKIEEGLGIRSAYFFQVCAKTYNLREAGNCAAVRALKAMGHGVGLHLDLAWRPDMRWEEVPAFCAGEKALLRAITGVEPCEIISLHTPHRFIDRIREREVPGMRHTYERRYFSSIKYLSDSQGWYEGCACRIFLEKRYPVIQLLTHADYWPESPSGSFVGDIARLVKLRADELVRYFLDFHPVCAKNETRLREELREVFRP